MSAPQFSIIIPTYKRPDLLERCLEKVDASKEQLDHPVEVIVSDDDPTSSAKATLANKFPWVHWHPGPGQGPATNRNAGASVAKGQWLIFLDDDCEPGKDWLVGFESMLTQADSIDVMEGKTTADRPKSRLDEESPVNEAGGYLWSCNFAVKRSVFEKIGGFDINFPGAAMEDIDLFVRLKKAGAQVQFVPEAVVVHPWRRCKPVRFLKLKEESHYTFWAKHPDQRPPSIAKYFGFMSVRTFIKVTLPGILKYRGKGALFAMQADGFWFCAAIRALFRKP